MEGDDRNSAPLGKKTDGGTDRRCDHVQLGVDLNAAGMNTMVGYVYDMLYGDGGGYPSYASAAAIILFAIVLTITVINLIVSRKTSAKG